MNAGLRYDPAAATRHLQEADPVMAMLIEQAGPFELTLRGEPFAALARSILHQQLAGAAARAIERRFMALFGDRYPTPEELATADPDALRAAGLSRQKLAALTDLAMKSLDGTAPLHDLHSLSDDEVIARVTQVRGVGQWTAEMLLMFSLGRPDVLPADDLGVRKGAMAAYELPALPDKAALTAIAERWRPYRSVACWYLWRALDGPGGLPPMGVNQERSR